MRALLWRNAGRAAAPVMLAVVIAHLALRNRNWTHEWMWAIYQFGFVTVLLGPLVAGVAAWEGWRLSSSADLLTTSLRPRQAAVQAWAATLAWGLAVYGVGLLTVAILVKASGTPGLPDIRTIAAALPPIALLGAEAALGLLAGWWIRHVLAAPAAALGVFLASLWIYTAGPSQFITVGGATASLVGLAPRPGLEIAQVCCFGAIALLAVLLTALPRPGSAVPSNRLAGAPVAASGVVLVAAAALLGGHGGLLLENIRANLVCVGEAPQVCVAPGYQADAAGARASLVPYLDRLAAAGVPVPAKFAQDASPGQRSVGPIDASFLLGDRSEAAFLVVNTYMDKTCFDVGSSRLQDEWSAIIAWLDPRVAKAGNAASGLPAVARGPSTPAQRAWVRAIMSDLIACGR